MREPQPQCERRDPYHWPCDDCAKLRPEEMVAKPEPSVPLSAIRALVQQWRADAERWIKRAIEIEDARVSGHFEGSAAQAAYCADQLAALCPAPPEET